MKVAPAHIQFKPGTGLYFAIVRCRPSWIFFILVQIHFMTPRNDVFTGKALKTMYDVDIGCIYGTPNVFIRSCGGHFEIDVFKYDPPF